MVDRWTKTGKLRTGATTAGLLACFALGCIEANRPSTSEDATKDGDATTIADGEVAFEIVECQGCVIATTCHADGEANPTNPCEVCDTMRALDGWSPVLESKVCQDSDACTTSGVCESGVCVTSPGTGCVGLPDCVTCDANCDQVVAADTCYIEGVCVADGVTSRDNCLVCDPGRDQTAWSATIARCDDGDPCTYEDTCDDGVCAGQENTCSDVFTCTLDFCDGGQCLHQIVSNSCLVNNECFTTGGSRAGDPCHTCQPDVSTTALSITPGASCDDQDACTTVSTCDPNGACAGEIGDVDSEPNDNLDGAQNVGIVANNAYPSGTVKANIVGDDTDTFRWGMTFTNNGVVFAPKASARFTVATQYELCVYARCGQVAASSFAPVVFCLESGESAADLDGHTRGCCRRTEAGVQTPMSLTASCAGTVVLGFGYARVRAIGEADAASCGGYSLDWGVGD